MKRRPLRFAIYEEDLEFPDRWSHAVRPRDECLAQSPGRSDDILTADVVAWLQANAARDGWRFVIVDASVYRQRLRTDANGRPRVIDIKTAEIDFEVWFTQANDALAFKMRWG